MERSLDYARDDKRKTKSVKSVEKLKDHYDQEGDRKIRDSAYRIDSIGDTDGTGSDIVRRRVTNE